MRRIALCIIFSMFVIVPARAVTCEEGMKVIDQMARVLQLSEFEQANIQALITKAKIEEEQGRQRNCKIIMADAIRFFLIKTILD